MKLKLTNEEISDICFELSLLLHSGTSVADSLFTLSDDTNDAEIKKMLKDMAISVEDGGTLAKAVKDAGVFPDHVGSLLDVGERSGRLEEALRSLSDYYESQGRISRAIKSALLYPSILMLVMLVVLVVLLVYVLPIFNGVYAQLGSKLTGVAGGLLAFGEILQKIMPVLGVLLGIAVIFFILFSSNDSFRNEVLGVARKRCRGKGLTWQIATSQFAQALAMGVSSGMPIEEAVELAGKTVSDIPEAVRRCKACVDKLYDGTSIADALSESGMMPKTESRLLNSAIRSGEGDLAIRRIADRLSEESESAISAKIAQIEPTLVIIGSLLVGSILLCVMLPLMNIMSTIG